MSETILEIKDLYVNYGYVRALNGISMHIDRGEIVTMIGSNGAGKTSCLCAISNLVEHIFQALTVEENLKAGAFGMNRFDKRKMKEMIDQVYVMFPRLKERRNQLGGTLSGGEQQMLAIGRGLMFSPKLLILDEPSLGLAPLVVAEIFELILDIRRKGTTVLLIEQNAGMALQVADRGYVLENGSITLQGSGLELSNNEKVIQAYLGM